MILKYKEVDIGEIIAKFPIYPYYHRIYVVEKEVEQSGLIIVPDTAKDKDMQTNEGWVVAIGVGVDFCSPGDTIAYARYSGAWFTVGGQKYRVMNEEDVLGKMKVEGGSNAGKNE